jgi:hypothetical protein
LATCIYLSVLLFVLPLVVALVFVLVKRWIGSRIIVVAKRISVIGIKLDLRPTTCVMIRIWNVVSSQGGSLSILVVIFAIMRIRKLWVVVIETIVKTRITIRHYTPAYVNHKREITLIELKLEEIRKLCRENELFAKLVSTTYSVQELKKV